YGSWARTASSTASEIWSQTLSGCPSVTDSDVNRLLRRSLLNSAHPLPDRLEAPRTRGGRADPLAAGRIPPRPGAPSENASPQDGEARRRPLQPSGRRRRLAAPPRRPAGVSTVPPLSRGRPVAGRHRASPSAVSR